MPALPVLLREVRACTLCAAHLPLGPRPVLQMHRRARILVAMIAIMIGAAMLISNAIDPQFEIGPTLFWALSGLSIFFCFVAGRLSTADSISEEKREGTIGFLFLTDLKGYDIVFGKVVATSLNSFYGLMAVFPVLAVPLLLGGMTNGEFWRMVIVLISTFLLSLAVGSLGPLASRWRSGWHFER